MRRRSHADTKQAAGAASTTKLPSTAPTIVSVGVPVGLPEGAGSCGVKSSVSLYWYSVTYSARRL